MKNKHYDLYEYLEWRGDLTFEQSPLNEVDALIFSIFAYLDLRDAAEGCEMDGCLLSDYLEAHTNDRHLELEGPRSIRMQAFPFGELATKTRRFEALRVHDYVSIIDYDREMQFSAVTFTIPGVFEFVSFRGTDSTLVGWKEDMNLSYSEGLPSQLEAAAYCDRVLEVNGLDIYTGGHSKGGNLAVWAASHLAPDMRERLVYAFSNDGPGFSKSFHEYDGYLAIKDRIKSFVPEESIVGILMEPVEYESIVSSKQLIMQHNPFTWYVSGTKIERAECRSKYGESIDKAVNPWIETIPIEERKVITDAIYEILTVNNVTTTVEIDNAKFKTLFSMTKTYRTLDPAIQKRISTLIGKMLFGLQDKPEKPEKLSKIKSIIESPDDVPVNYNPNFNEM